MKSLVLYGPNGNFKYEENWEKPKIKSGWAVVKVSCAGLCGSDIPRFKLKGSYHHPIILGHEFSGVVEDIEENDHIKVGNRVAVVPIIPCGECEGCKKFGAFHCKNYQYLGSRNDGGFAEYCLVPISNLIKLPDSVDIEIAALIEPLMVGLHVVHRSKILENLNPERKVLVIGAGTIGLMVSFWLKELGVKNLTIVDIRSMSITLARSMGFADVRIPEQIADLENEFDYAFEAAGSQIALMTIIDVLKPKAMATIVGRDTHDTLIPLDKFEKILRKELTINGCWGFETEDIPLVLSTLSKTQIPLNKIITERISIENSETFIRDFIAGKVQANKIIIDFNIRGV